MLERDGMPKLIACCFIALVVSGCASSPPISVRVAPKTDDQIFFESLHYPYQASAERRRKIELAIKALRPGDTESEVWW